MNSSLREHHTASAQDDGSVVGAALGLVECLNAYEQGRRESHAPPTLPPLTLLGDREVEEFLGTLPTLTDEQLDRLLTLAQIEADKRAFDREHEDAIELPLREVA